MHKISIIVPVYNTEKYLRRCVDSILAQTFTDFELLLIDDGSSDRSGVICDEYALKDSRVRVFHKENGGVSSARNLGLDNATGEWISFVDSDDWIDGNYLFDLLIDETCDLNVCNFKIEGSDEKWDAAIEEGTQLTPSIENLFKNGGFSGYAFFGPTCKLFRKSIIDKNKIRYRENISSGEDTLFVLEFFCYIDKYFGIEKNLYHYWQPGNGLSSQKNLALNFILLAKESKKIADVLCVKFSFDKTIFLSKFLSDGFYAYLRNVITETSFNEEQIKELYFVFPYEYYIAFISKFGRLLRLSSVFYKYSLFKIYVFYLKALKKSKYPFFK